MLATLKIKALHTGPGVSPLIENSHDAVAPTAASVATASSDPLHFFVAGDTITIDETRPAPNAAGFFLRQIDALSKITNAPAGGHGGWAGGGGRRGRR